MFYCTAGCSSIDRLPNLPSSLMELDCFKLGEVLFDQSQQLLHAAVACRTWAHAGRCMHRGIGKQ
jgi:hypothetical protein